MAFLKSFFAGIVVLAVAMLAKSVLVLWRRRLFIVLGGLLVGLAALVWSLLTPPTYEATQGIM